MKKFIAMLTLLIGFNASAGLITVDFSTANIAVGDTVSVTINATDFDETDLFYFDFYFDNAIMAFNDASLSSDLTLASANPMLNGLSASKEGFGLGFEFATDDLSLMAIGDFMLASFSLTASSAGLANVAIIDFINFSAFNDYTIIFTGTDTINVSSATVPEPSSIALVLLAGLGFIRSRSK